MAATVTKDYAFKLMRDNECQYWTAKDNTDSGIVGQQQDEDCNVEASIECLRECLDACAGSGTIYVHIKDKTRKDSSKGGDIKSKNFSVRVKVDGAASSQSSPVVADPSNSVAGLNETIRGLEKQLQQSDFDHKMSDMKKEIEEIKKKDPLEGWIPVIMKAMGQEGVELPPPGIAGTEGEDEPEIKPDTKKIDRLKGILLRLKKLDPDYVTLLEAIVVMGEDDDSAFNNYGAILKGQLAKAKKDAKDGSK